MQEVFFRVVAGVLTMLTLLGPQKTHAIGVFFGQCKIFPTMKPPTVISVEGFWQGGMHPSLDDFDFPTNYSPKMWPPACYVSALSACYIYAYALEQIWNTPKGQPKPKITYPELRNPLEQFWDTITFKLGTKNFEHKVEMKVLDCLDLPEENIPEPKWWGRPYPAIDVWLDERGIDLDRYQKPHAPEPFLNPNLLPKSLPKGVPQPGWWEPSIRWLRDVIEKINQVGELIQKHAWKLVLFQIAIGLIILAIVEIGTVVGAPVGFAKLLGALAIIVGICQSIGIDFQFSNPSFRVPSGPTASLQSVYEENKEEIAALIKNVELWGGSFPLHFKMNVGGTQVEMNFKDALIRYRESLKFRAPSESDLEEDLVHDEIVWRE